jgi:hypothetical protein
MAALAKTGVLRFFMSSMSPEPSNIQAARAVSTTDFVNYLAL